MKIFKKIICIFAIFSMLVCCAAGLTSCVDSGAARDIIGSFIVAINNSEYTTAQAYLHPDRVVDLEEFFKSIEQKEDIDFQSDIKNLEFYGNTLSGYDSDYDGSAYSTTVYITYGKTGAVMNFTIVENDAGFGIYHFDFQLLEE